MIYSILPKDIENENLTSNLDSCSYSEETSRWVQTEFSSANLPDARLNTRLLTIMDSFCSSPNVSIPHTALALSKIKAAYRFLNNSNVTPENILQPHQQATQTRINKEQIVLAIQDTTTLNYTSHPATSGLGTIGTDPTLRGMLVHTTIAITPERVPLGIIHQQTWVRPPEEYGKKHQRHKKPIEEKESQKWINSFQVTDQLQKKSPQISFINIGDRESDIYELFYKAVDVKTSCNLLVRAAWDRCVNQEQNHLWPYLEAQPLASTFSVTVPRKNKKAERIATVELRFAQVTLKPPYNKKTLPPITLFAIYVNEPFPPNDEEPLSWMVLTTLSVNSKEDALRYVQYYAVRYSIEVFHKILKSGCRIEKHQLKTADALKRCLALDSIVAWRIMFLTMLGRVVPNLPCTVILQEYEWKALYCFVHNTSKPPENSPSLQEAIRMIARLGGFLGRKSDGHPGVQVLWQGMQQLTIISLSWKVFGPK